MMKLGESESMYFELSVAEVWLVAFDIVGMVEMARRKKLFAGLSGKWWVWVLVPVWLALSVAWSLNTTRGALTAGLMWAIVTAGYVMWGLRDVWDEGFRRRWWKWFFGSTLVVCGWCVVQCVLDLVGVPQEYTLMCGGCTYRMFGFPHPNGFAIEPQFMGNLLLAPMMVSAYLYLAKKHASKNDNGSHSLCSKVLLACFFAITFTIFLTFSRGAIYAGVVGMMVVSGVEVARYKKKGRGVMWKRVGVVWLAVVGAFVVALVTQGVMAEVSPTSDTFGDGVAKVVEHLSLGVIKTRGEKEARRDGPESGNGEVVENLEGGEAQNEEVAVENTEVDDDGQDAGAEGTIQDTEVEGNKQEAVFDGYVAESTDTRVRLSGAAFEVWRQDFKTAMVGVGLGGAGQALYNNGLSPAPREIVQNEYVSLLLETGVVGVVLCIIVIAMAVRVMWRSSARVMLVGLVVAYGVSLLFFSGLPNALQVYLMPVVLMVACGGMTGIYRKV
ncbi:O-antigen ligase family protein [Candidatus Saccharibacteria bacterium]|nr:O-antigen ligase family protein [Candidatus Saccharibacteria bacterium]